MSEETAEEWILEFHGNSFIVNVLCNDVLLTLEVEDEESGERWSGEFTSQYIEETTHKAGNFKKFGVFTKMLSSAFSKNNESVFVDLLTLADLELLKARKSGHGSSSTRSDASQISSKKQMKRYVILTYTGEFDRVHYPLPLAFEEQPNAVALQRTIRRLRGKLREKVALDQAPASEKEKELRQIVSQLRQENTELRHRLRQVSSRSARSGNAGNASFVSNIHSPGDAIENAASVNADLASTNRKLKRQVDDLKKELHQSAEEIEKIKRESAKEVMKWKKRISGKSSTELSVMDDAQKTKSRQDSEMVVDLRKKIISLERELKLERLNKGLPSSRPGSASRFPGDSWNSSVAVQSLSARNTGSSSRRATSASLSTRETQARHSSSNRSRSMSPLERTSDRNRGKNYTPAGNPSRLTKDVVASRRETPPRRSIAVHGYDDNSTMRSFSPSSSSLGKRFDPTGYHLAKETRSKSAAKAWGAGSSAQPSHNRRYDSPRESGYSSSNSQASNNSRGSNRSDRGNLQKKTKKHSKDRNVKKVDLRSESPTSKSASKALQSPHKKDSGLKPAVHVATKYSSRVVEPSPPLTRNPARDVVSNQSQQLVSRHEDRENFKINVPTDTNSWKKRENEAITAEASLKDNLRSSYKSQDGNDSFTASTLMPRHSFELKNEASLNLSTSLVEQVHHVDNDISDIDKRIQALQSYLENARANMKTKDDKQ